MTIGPFLVWIVPKIGRFLTSTICGLCVSVERAVSVGVGNVFITAMGEEVVELEHDEVGRGLLASVSVVVLDDASREESSRDPKISELGDEFGEFELYPLS